MNTPTRTPAIQARMAIAAPLPVEGNAPVDFVYMPAGRHTITARHGLHATTVTVEVTSEAAEAIEQQRQAVQARSAHRPYFDFNHEDREASFWPDRFYWADAETESEGKPAGVMVHGEWSAPGQAAIVGKAYRSFSPTFHVDDLDHDPARVVCDPDASLNFGGLVNAPAFHQMPPLWAKADEHNSKQMGNPPERRVMRCGASERDAEHKGEKQMKETLAELEAKLDRITTELAELRAGDKAGSANPEAIAAKEREAEWARQLIASAEKDAQIADLRQQIQAKAEKEAEEAIEAAIARGALAAKDHEARARWKKLLAETPANLVLLQALQGNAALGASITRGPGAPALATFQAKEGPARILKAYAELATKNAGITPVGAVNFERKGQLAREMAAIYKREISARMAEFEGMPLMAADYTDPAGNLGTLSGTLVAQRCLELFKLTFPVLTRITTDFSDLPAQFKQTIATRVVMVPAVQAYDPTPDTTGRPKGWSTVSAAQTKDVLVTLDEHVGVPIVFDANTLASTVRRLFDEMAPAAAYALAKYFVEKIYKLFTPANYNAYAKVNGAKVPAALPTFAVGIEDFARSSLTKLAAILNPNEVPIQDRVCLLNSPYFEQLATDPSLVTFFAGQQSPEIVTENRLPKLANFEPIEAPNLNAPNVTPNLVGMALHKAAVVAMTRLSNDYTQALPGSSYGSVTTITDPDLGISVVLVQYVNHTGGYAEWRIQVFLGAAVGDNRGGLCITSQ